MITLRRTCVTLPRFVLFPPDAFVHMRKPSLQEIDRHEDLLRACLRAVDAIQRLPGADGAPAWQAFVKRTVLAAGMKERYAQVGV